jgi:23S rRNA (guanine745-N1)-methyltransferase
LPRDAILRCPVCAGAIADQEDPARCPRGHSFDHARSGYLNLARATGQRSRSGDTAAMVGARAQFLEAGHFEPIADAVATAAAAAATNAAGPPVLAELGSGTGYYLATAARQIAAAGNLGAAVGIDLSKAAAARAARAHASLTFVVADVEDGIPLLDSSADVALSVFAPRPAGELGRVVRPGGGLVAAFAGPRHLETLRRRLGLLDIGERKLERLGERLAPWFEPISAEPLEYEIELDPADAVRLAAMGPSAWHDADPASLTDSIVDVVSVVAARFRRGIG